jgi:hypothetical protein
MEMIKTRNLRTWAWRYHTPNIARFLTKNNDLNAYDKERGLNYIDFVEVMGRIEAIIPVMDMTLENIRDLWHKIAEWKRRLDDYQGPETRIAAGFTYEALWRAHKELRMSCQKIADELNLQILGLLLADLQQVLSQSQAPTPFTYTIEALEFYQLLKEAPSNRPGYFAITLMQRIGIKDNDAVDWMNQALSNVRNGHQPFPPRSPITKEMIRERIRDWNKKRR